MSMYKNQYAFDKRRFIDEYSILGMRIKSNAYVKGYEIEIIFILHFRN